MLVNDLVSHFGGFYGEYFFKNFLSHNREFKTFLTYFLKDFADFYRTILKDFPKE